MIHFLIWVASPAFTSSAEPAGSAGVAGPLHTQFPPAIHVQATVPATIFHRFSDNGGGGAAADTAIDPGDGSQGEQDAQTRHAASGGAQQAEHTGQGEGGGASSYDGAGNEDSTLVDEDPGPDALTGDAAVGSVTLNWMPPTEQEDGTPLMDLAGFRIYWHNINWSRGQSIDVDNPYLSAIVIGNLPAGTYEFAMTAYNAAGVESGLSNTITRIVGAAGGDRYAAGTVTTDDLPQSAVGGAAPAPYLMLSGEPNEAVIAGHFYLFTPGVETNSESEPLFAIESLPRWAGFDETSGELYGTPTEADVGRYGSIMISATDGVIETSLPIFSIDVVAPGAPLGSVTLIWLPPTEYEDGAPLTDLAGYRIYWRHIDWSQSQSIDAANPGLSAIVIGNLPAGIYEFTMTAYNAVGVESVLSNTITCIVGVPTGTGDEPGAGTTDQMSQSTSG